MSDEEGKKSPSPPCCVLTSYISGHQNGQIFLLKVTDDFVPLTLVHVSVQKTQAVSLLCQVSSQFLTVCLLGNKDENGARGGKLNKPPRQPTPFIRPTGQQLHYLGHILIGLIRQENLNFLDFSE